MDAVSSAIEAHAAADSLETDQLRATSLSERARMLAAACATAAEIERNRIAAGMPRTEAAPWPPSTWEFLRKQALHVRG